MWTAIHCLTGECEAITEKGESSQSWRELLLDLKRRGLSKAPDLAIGDGALGFWTALREVFGTTQEQRCWVHKTGNVLNAMPKSLQAKAKGHLQDIWMAETKEDAEAAFDFLVEAYGVKYDRAVEKLTKDRDVLLTFHDFPAEHWKHIRTSNPHREHICHRAAPNQENQRLPRPQDRPGDDLSPDDVRKKEMAQTRRRLPPAEIIEGVEFKDGIKQEKHAA